MVEMNLIQDGDDDGEGTAVQQRIGRQPLPQIVDENSRVADKT